MSDKISGLPVASEAIAGNDLVAVVNVSQPGTGETQQFTQDQLTASQLNLIFRTATELTIASGVITLTQSNHKLQPELGTADDLETISGMSAGQVAVLIMSDPGTDTLTIKHGIDNISCAGAADITFSEGALICYSDGTTVYVSGGGGGAVEVATSAELDTGTDNAKMATALAIAGRSETFGWTPARQSWAYASATTITVPSGAELIYSVGDKIRFKQGAEYKYFYIIAVADTLLTVTGGSDYTVATPTAITDIYYSKAASSVGFPKNGFSIGTPTWTTSGTPFTNQPINNDWKIFIISGMMTITGQAQCHATSGGTGVFTATFPAGLIPQRTLSPAGNAVNFNTSVLGISSANAFDLIRMSKYDGTTLATNSEYFGASITMRI